MYFSVYSPHYNPRCLAYKRENSCTSAQLQCTFLQCTSTWNTSLATLLVVYCSEYKVVQGGFPFEFEM